MTDTNGTAWRLASVPAIHAASDLDPRAHPELYEGVRTRRMLAFFLDVALIIVFTVMAYIAVLIAGILTAGLGWLMLGIVYPVVALTYTALTLGLRSRTIGMGLLGLEMRLLDGPPMTVLMAIGHALLFYIITATLTPLAMVVSLFNRRKRLVHDMLLGTVVINDAVKASTYRPRN